MTTIAASLAGFLPAFRPNRRYVALKTTSSLEMKNVEGKRKRLKDYFEESKDLIKSDGGPPRWFSPLECGSRSHGSPLLLFLPGIDGVGLGLIKHHHMLGKIYDIWCLHIPVKDRTSFTGLVQLVEKTVRSESQSLPSRPIYLVGESLGACIALAVASRNPTVDLVLILANPGDLLKTVTNSMLMSLPLQQTVGDLFQDFAAISSYLSVLTDILPQKALLWKLQMLKTASSFVNSHLHVVEAQTLILCSGRDQLLPSEKEGERLRSALQKCEIHHFWDNGHFLFMEDGVDLVSIIKGAYFYRRGKYLNYVSDYVPLTPSELNRIRAIDSLIKYVTSPVMLSTSENGKIVRGIGGIPSEGPVLLVGYHMLLGMELIPMIYQLFTERKISLRGIAHPFLFTKLRDGNFHYIPPFDGITTTGAVPVSANNFYELLSTKSYMLLYPGGIREALHRKGEEYKLFWPDQSEFIRMAARFGAKIIPFGVVGEDDVAELLLDYDDQMKIPFLKSVIEEMTNTVENLRADGNGEVANQDLHFPIFLPKFPGRFYYYFGKPIDTQGRHQELRDREKCRGLYLQVQSEVEKCIAYLKNKREIDPYRNISHRIVYRATHGFSSEVPTFDF